MTIDDLLTILSEPLTGDPIRRISFTPQSLLLLRVCIDTEIHFFASWNNDESEGEIDKEWCLRVGKRLIGFTVDAEQMDEIRVWDRDGREVQCGAD
jgi:hypothetical protein